MTNDGSSGIFSAFDGAIEAAVEKAVAGIAALLDPILSWVVNELLTDTPHPTPASGGIFGAPPTDSTFYNLYNIYHDAILPISTLLVLLGLAVFLFTGIWSAKKERVTAIRRLMFAIPAILIWWYVAGWYLQFVQGFTDLLLQVGMQQSATGNLLISDAGDVAGGIVALLVLYVIGILPIAAVLAIYLMRWIAIHLYMAGMPLLIAIWCIPVGPFSSWAESMIKKFVPITLIPIPVAFLLSMFAVIDVSSVAGNISGELFDMIIGLIVLGLAAVIPKTMLSMNLGSSLSTAARGVRYAAAGAATGSMPGGKSGSGSQTSGSGTSAAAQSGLGDYGGGSPDADASPDQDGAGSLQESTHSNTFAHPTASKSRRQRERAAKVGAGGRKMGATLHGASAKTLSKSGSAAETAAGTAYKNYTKDGSTAKGIASDAKQGAKKRGKQAGKKAASAVKSPLQGMSKRMQNARDNMARRSQEFTEKWGHEDATQWPNASSLEGDDLPDIPPAENELAEMGEETPNVDELSQTDGESPRPVSRFLIDGTDDLAFIDDYSRTDQVSRDTTYDRNSTDREVGSFGGD